MFKILLSFQTSKTFVHIIIQSFSKKTKIMTLFNNSSTSRHPGAIFVEYPLNVNSVCSSVSAVSRGYTVFIQNQSVNDMENVSAWRS